jgi:hypothetical protein
MPDEVPSSTGPSSTGPTRTGLSSTGLSSTGLSSTGLSSTGLSGAAGIPGYPAMVGPICRAAPTRLAAPDLHHARSRRWLIVGSIVVAGLLAGASVALAEDGSAPAAPPHATRTSTHVGSVGWAGSAAPVAGL